ncbi:MAG: cobalamin biosynthesis protein [Acetobacteraceae bacterium]|nr:cobalamin biosynthesis protein [Acetobacteraceae bacterium]
MSGRVIAGVGCRRGCAAEEILRVLDRAGMDVAAIAVPAFKADEPGVMEAARRLGVPVIRVDDAALAEAQARCVTRSRAAARATGFASVAEGSALAASGPRGRLVLARIAVGGATCALAEAPP